jgi:chondroitin 4-sulfotransferase 11
MISHKHKFIFIHIRKTGGTSIEKIFVPTAGNTKNDVPYKHHSSSEMQRKFPKEWKEYFTFSFVRNPWSWLVSRYTWSKYTQGVITCTSFEDFIGRVNKGQFTGWLKTALEPQVGMLLDINDRLMVDFVGRFENIQEDFNIVCNKIGTPEQQLPYKNATKHKHYTEYYDDETKSIVAEKYAKDIEYFGYEFGE